MQEWDCLGLVYMQKQQRNDTVIFSMSYMYLKVGTTTLSHFIHPLHPSERFRIGRTIVMNFSPQYSTSILLQSVVITIAGVDNFLYFSICVEQTSHFLAQYFSSCEQQQKYSNNDHVSNQVANQHSFVMLQALVMAPL